MRFPWGPLIYIILGLAGAGAGYYIGDTFFDNGGSSFNSSFVDPDPSNVTAAFLYLASSDDTQNYNAGAGKHVKSEDSSESDGIKSGVVLSVRMDDRN